MNNIKNIIAIILTIIFTMDINASNIYAITKIKECKEAELLNLEVTKDNLREVAKKYNIPREVVRELKIMSIKKPYMKVILSNTEQENLPKNSYHTWGTCRLYKKTKIKDWIITKQASFKMENIKKGEGNSVVIDTFWNITDEVIATVPYSGIAVSIGESIIGNKNGYNRSYGDILEAAPSFTTKEKFTYVYIGDDYYLGTKSYCAKIDSISWRFFSDSLHKNFNRTVRYNKTIKTEHYNKLDEMAILSYGSGGCIDEPPTFNIGKAVFNIY